jgi:hypothetical protein
MTTQDQVIALARASKRPSGKCLGFTNNDVVGAFGKMGRYPDFATQAADELEKAGQLYTTPCPDYPHVDFYDYVATIQGVRKNWGHTDWHFPQRGLHVANSSRVTANKNATGTTGTYASYGGARRGWAKVPALGAQISIVNDATPTPPPPSSGGGKKDVDTVAREVIAGNWGRQLYDSPYLYGSAGRHPLWHRGSPSLPWRVEGTLEQESRRDRVEPESHPSGTASVSLMGGQTDTVGEYEVPVDPMDAEQCDSCQ